MNEKSWPAVSLAQANALMTAPGAPFEMDEATIGGQRLRIWKNAPATLRDVFVAGRAHGAAIFLVHADERVSFEGFARATIALAHWLTSGASGGRLFVRVFDGAGNVREDISGDVLASITTAQWAA